MAGLFGGARRALGNFTRTDEQGRTFGDKLGIIGATMRSVSDPSSGALDQQIDRLRQSQARRQHEMSMDRFRSDIAPHDGPNGSGTGAAKTPQELQSAFMNAAGSDLNVGQIAQAYDRFNPEPKFYNTRDGVVQVMPDGTSKVVFKTEPEQADTRGSIPAGMQIGTDGRLSFIPGYVEEQRRLTGGRRDEIISRPPPRAGRSTGGGSRGSSRPVASTPARRPWENYR